MDTKFIERHERALREWLDIVLSPDAILAGEAHFARRYGLRFAEPHWLIRFLDPGLQIEAGVPFSEFSIPLATLARLPFSDVNVFIVENKVNMLTLPPMRSTLALGGVGRAATELRHVDWLRDVPIVYCGDIDVAGLWILSAWRTIFPQTQSLFMDADTLKRHGSPTSCKEKSLPDIPPHLSEVEQQAFVRCCDGTWLEQQRIPQSEVVAALRGRMLPLPDAVRIT